MSAVLVGNVLYSDQIYYRHAGPRRYFWLLSEGVQLIYEPFGWEHEWYIDLVSIRRFDSPRGPLFRVHDRLIDIVVEGDGPTYRIIDLEEAAEALTSGIITAQALAEVLTATQNFLDRYLHRRATFPPAAIRSMFFHDHTYPAWSQSPVRLRAHAPSAKGREIPSGQNGS